MVDNVEMAVFLISAKLLEMIFSRTDGNEKSPGKAPFSDFQSQFHGHAGERVCWKCEGRLNPFEPVFPACRLMSPLACTIPDELRAECARDGGNGGLTAD
jgi:hypothetical protein